MKNQHQLNSITRRIKKAERRGHEKLLIKINSGAIVGNLLTVGVILAPARKRHWYSVSSKI